MDPLHRGGWPQQQQQQQQQQGGSAHGGPEQGQGQGPPPSRPAGSYGPGHQSPPQGSALPPPQGTSFSHYHQQPPSLQNLAGISQSPPRQPQSSQRGEGPPQPPSQGPGVALPGFSQATGQPGAAERERDRAREAEQIHIKEEEDRKYREQQERLRLEQTPLHQTQQGPPPHLHQPVALGPRTVHGPNGLLGHPGIAGPQPSGQIPMGAPSGPSSIFPGGPVQPVAQAIGPNAQQQMQSGMLMPYAPGAQQQPSNQQQQQSQQQIAQGQGQGQGQGQQPILNDALSYLDQVKVQFADHPDVYNRFLDIMKDFKSGAIDTPGVIGRVSTLFAGNPELIQGFNTFLPPGYRIECGAGDDPNAIRVTTPMGTTVQAMPQPRPMSRQEGGEAMRPTNGTYSPQPGQQGSKMMFSPSVRPVGPAGPGASQQQQQGQQHFSALDAQRQQEQQAMHQQEQRGVDSLSNAVTAATSREGLHAGLSPRQTPIPGQQLDANGMTHESQAQQEKRGPVEFNHAISYVNKIKNRFSSQPDIYKQFLEILQTYQRESKPIQDVYGQVTVLFKGAPDLLEDFKQFLPESAAQAKAAEKARQAAEESVMTSNVRGDPGPYTSPGVSRDQQMGTPNHANKLPPVGNFAPTPISKETNKRKRGDRQATVGSVADNATGPGAAKQGAYNNQQGKRLKQTHPVVKGPSDQPPPSPTLVPALPTPLAPTTTSAATHDELQFFDRAKKSIASKNTMNEFLKLCNMFSQDYIDRAQLVYRARAFIGNHSELMSWFQSFLGYEEKDVVIENKARVPTGRISLSNCRGLGPSYRLLPKRERVKPCSGRDELCNSVLNDEWASHPTWASEDSGFIAHRKNTFEEALHRIEEERHDYDYNIEACSRTIQLMEPIAQHLHRMSDAEMVNYTLPPGLGGHSESIYKRVIMKVYGRDKGHEVITNLHKAPYQVIPVVLNRLRERLESWKMAQREWEKIWRDQTQKMFWRSLDHQAVSSRTSNHRQFQMKTLQADVQTKHEEMRRQALLDPLSYRRGEPQLTTKVEDMDVICDATYLVLVHLEASRDTDTPRLAPFIREFVPMFFGIDADAFQARLRHKFGETPLEGDVGEEPLSGAEDSASIRGRTKKSGNSMYRNVLDPGSKGGRFGRTGEGSAVSESRGSTPEVASTAAEDADAMAIDAATDDETKPDLSSNRWFSHPAMDSEGPKKLDPNEPAERHVYRLWANTPVYCFIRMFVMLYERLRKLKSAEAECRETVKKARIFKPASDLGIGDKTPADFFSNIEPNANYYTQMIEKFALFLEGEAEWADVEECLRRYYLHAGYPLYQFEKMIQALVRYGASVVNPESNKDRSWDILQLWKKDRVKSMVSAVQTTDYRKGFEKLVREGDGYAIDWDERDKLVRIYLAKKDDADFGPDAISEQDQETKWRYYIASYSSVEETDNISYKELSPVMLFRSVRAIGADPKSDRYPPAALPASGEQPTAAGSPSAAAAGQQNGDDSKDGNTANTTETSRVGDRVLSRILGAKNDERLILRVAVNKYHILFQPNTAESLIEDPVWRVGGDEGVKDSDDNRGSREETMREGFEMNHTAMKDLSREQVESKNQGFIALAESGGEVSEGAKGEKMETDE